MESHDQQSGFSQARSTRPVHYGLDSFFKPRSIALICQGGGADDVGDAVWKNLAGSLNEKLVRRIVAGADGGLVGMTDALGDSELAVIVAPEEQQLGLACACDEVGIRAALLMSVDGREPVRGDLPWPAGTVELQCPNGLRILGPQSFGLMSPHLRLNITAGAEMARAGSIAFLSQSGAMCASVLDWSFRTGVGFSAMVSCEIMADVGWADLITHFGDDPRTKSIVIYLESIGDARAFLSAAREVALSKPIILLKAGAATAADVPGHVEGSDEAVLSAALQRVGVLRVRRISEMFYMATILASQPLPRGPRLAILTNSMAPAMLATDVLRASGGELAVLSESTVTAVSEITGGVETCVNPVDIFADADGARYEAAAGALRMEPEIDGMLVILTPQGKAEPAETARRIVKATARLGKPVLAGWMGGDGVEEGQDILFEAGIPAFPYPDTPARLFSLMWRHAQNLKGIYETPSVIIDEAKMPVDIESAGGLLTDLRTAGNLELREEQAAAVLRYYGIPVDGAAKAGAEDYELMAGSRIDPLFGPVMYFGIGGRATQFIYDIPLGLPPLTSALALRMIERSRTWQVLKDTETAGGQRRLSQLQGLLVRLSQLVVQQPVIRSLKIDPLVARADSIVVPAAVITLHESSVADADLPRPAIRPYPVQYVWSERIRSGEQILIRPVRPEDEPLIIEFHRTLSEETIYRRYFFQHKFSRRTSHERLRRTCFLDFDREIALAAVVERADVGAVVAGVGRLARNRAGDSAEIALMVSDDFQSQGIGTYLLSHLVDIARAEGIGHVEGTMLPGNIHMQHLFGKLDFEIGPGADDTVVAKLRL